MARTRGLDSLMRKLGRLAAPSELFPVVERGLDAGSLRIESSTKSKAPVITGQLRRSYTHETEVTGQGVRAVIGTNLEYAPRVELGFSGTDSRGRTFSQAGKPHLRPAFDENKNAALNDVAQVVRQHFKSIATGS